MRSALRTVALSLMSVMFVVLLTSAVPAPSATSNAASSTVVVKSKSTYQQLKTSLEQIKGQKLTLKEKIGLRVFGKKIANKSAAPFAEGKSQIIALVLVALLGGLGIHRFYLGYTWQGVVQLLTLGGCGVWALIDLVRIITGDLQPKDGTYEKTL